LIKTFRNILLTLFLCSALGAGAQNDLTRILFVLDGSGSMAAEMGGKSRINVAKRLLSQLVDSLGNTPDVEVALRVYGHTQNMLAKDCEDTKLEVPFAEDNIDAIKSKLLSIQPKGYTLIAKSLLEAASDFPDTKARNIIILITDGLEECNGDPCAISKALQKKGVILKPFVIGIGADQELFKEAFSCIGKYYDATTEKDFQNVLNIVISQSLDATSAQINLVDDFGKPLETNVGMTIYDATSGEMLHNYEHTMNGFGVPDTLYLDPVRKYDILVHTLPSVRRNNIELVSGRHNIIAIKAGQGSIKLIMDGLTKYDRLQAVVTLAGEKKTIYAQEFNTIKKYLVGSYDLEILTLPRVELSNVQVRQNHTTNITIEQPGVMDIRMRSKLVGAIYRMNAGKMEWVYDIPGAPSKQEILLQPGEYIWVYRIAAETRTIYTREKKFTIKSGSVTEVQQM
jgi:Ca-activated chloride channel family protein